MDLFPPLFSLFSFLVFCLFSHTMYLGCWRAHKYVVPVVWHVHCILYSLYSITTYCNISRIPAVSCVVL